MKAQDYNDAMMLMAGAEQRSTATLIENIAALVLFKLNPPARGDDVVQVAITPAEVESLLLSHHVESEWIDGSLTVSITPLDSVP